jgi:arylsulfatase A-like enzyme
MSETWTVVSTALLMGLVLGLVEGSYLLAKLFLWRSPVTGLFGASADMAWLAPLANAVVLGAVALLGLILTSRARWLSDRTDALVLGLAVLSLTQWSGRLHMWAGALVALGVAVRWDSGGRPGLATLRRVAPRWSVPALSLVLAFGIGMHAWARRSAAAEAPLPAGIEAAASGRPNVVLLVLDTERANSLALFTEGGVSAPATDGLAAGGVRFASAIAPSSWTLPSHASLFTGRAPPHLGAGRGEVLTLETETLAQAFANAGYETRGYAGNLHFLTPLHGLTPGFEAWDSTPLEVGTALSSAWLVRQPVTVLRRVLGLHPYLIDRTATDVNRSIARWKERRADDRPFFVFVNYFDAHEPYVTESGGSLLSQWRGPINFLARGESADAYSAEEISELRAGYEAAITELDGGIGEVLALLASGDTSNTLVVVTSDHGEEFGGHGAMSHGHTLYQPALRVPLVMRLPGVLPAGLEVVEPVGIIDVAATLLDLAGVTGHSVGGRSFAGALRSGAAMDPRIVFSETGDERSVVADSFHLIRHADGAEELYRLDDRWEARPLSGAVYAPVVSALQGLLDQQSDTDTGPSGRR